MLDILFNTTTLIIYLLFISCQYLTKLSLSGLTGKVKTILTIVANIGNSITFCSIIYYSYLTSWWYFIFLINFCIIFFVTLDFVLSKSLNNRNKRINEGMYFYRKNNTSAAVEAT